MYKILIDTRMIGLEHAGIGRYIANLVREIKNFEFYLLVKPEKLQGIKKEFDHQFHYIKVPANHYSLKEQLLLPLILRKIKPDLIHFPHFNAPVFCPYPFVVTIHDLIKHAFRGRETTTRNQFIYWLKYLLYRFVFWWTIKRAKRIITPSQTVKEELIKRYNLPPEKVVVIYQGVEEKLKAQSSKLKATAQNAKPLEKYNIKKPFLIYTGSLYPHKNIDQLIQSIKLVNQSKPYCLNPIALIIVCARNIFWERTRKKIKEMKAEKLVKLIGFVPDKELIKLYQEAVAFIQPSLMEGFDLPPLEAMAAGLPCLLSDIPVHQEIYKDVPWYFDPKNITDISKTIKLVLKSSNTTEYWSKRKAGIELAKEFTWQKTTQKTLKVYQQTLTK